MTMPGTNHRNLDELRKHFGTDLNYTTEDIARIYEDASRVYSHCQPPSQPGKKNGLLYGHIQSGKTAVIIATIALAIDSGYRNFIVLTTDLNDLYQQTLERIQKALHGAQIIGKKQFKQSPMPPSQGAMVLVASKNSSVMGKLVQLISDLGRRNETFMIIDDEADQASLNTNINKQGAPASGVNQQFLNLFAQLSSYTFLQTTATPEALLLQDESSPFKPTFVVAARPSDDYVGGNYFFDQNTSHTRIVAPIDVQNLRTSNELPASVAQSIYLFFTGAAVLRLKGSQKNYTYLLHSSLKQVDHNFAFGVINRFYGRLTGFLASPGPLDPTLIKGIEDAYADLSTNFPSMPAVEAIITEIKNRIQSTEIVEINANTGAGVNPSPPRRHTLYIGGAKIGRGVTVKNLIVTYYGRDAKSPQVDTVLQHARMYGYRKDDLPATRIFLPLSLEARFIDIHETDNSIRDLCEQTQTAIPVIPLGTQMRPTRAAVLNAGTVSLRAYVGGHKYFPMLPISDPAELKDQTAKLDALLDIGTYNDTQTSYTITIDQLLELLDFDFKHPDSPGAWSDKLIRESIKSLKDKYCNRASLVIVNRHSELKKTPNRQYRWIGAVLPGGLAEPPYGVSKDYPALYMTRLNGKVAPLGGWHGVPFWIPVVRFPSGNYAVAVNYSGSGT